MKKKLLASLVSAVMVASVFSGCGNSAATTETKEASTNETAETKQEAETTEETSAEASDGAIDYSALAGTTVQVYTHGSNRVLGEEKKDENGNTYRDESYAYLKHLAERFTQETGINVELKNLLDTMQYQLL